MRLDLPGDGLVIVTLSRRNLLTLLAKLKRGVPGVILSQDVYLHGTPVDGVMLVVRPASDEEAYRDRPAGPMQPHTEAAILWAEARATDAEDDGKAPDAG